MIMQLADMLDPLPDMPDQDAGAVFEKAARLRDERHKHEPWRLIPIRRRRGPASKDCSRRGAPIKDEIRLALEEAAVQQAFEAGESKRVPLKKQVLGELAERFKMSKSTIHRRRSKKPDKPDG